MLVFAMGMLCFALSYQPLGALLMIGAVAKAVTEAMTFRAVEVRLQQMEDARIENEFYLDLYRARTGTY